MLNKVELLQRKKNRYWLNREYYLSKMRLNWSKHRDKYIQWKRDYKKKIKREVLLHYSNNTLKCTCCGESIYEFLTIDHINNDGKEHRKQIGTSSHAIYSWLLNNGFPIGYATRCFNCNCGRKLGICPHLKLNKERNHAIS